MTDFMKLGMWVVLSTSVTHIVWITRCTYQIAHLYIYSDWLKMQNIQSYMG